MSGRVYSDKQKLAYYKKKVAGSAMRPRRSAVSGRGAYKKKSAGGGGKYYYNKYKAAKAASSTADQDGGWLSSGLGAIGNALLPGIGGAAGRGLGSLIKSVTGFGDYTVNQNSLVAEAGAPPIVSNISRDKIFIVRHREYISDVISHATPNTFKLENYYINPAQAATFPWLAGVAANFEHYQIRGMLFEFRTMSADALNSTNTALGQVVMATNYNSSLNNFVNKYEMENYEYGQSVKPSESCTHPIECARAESVLGDLYVRPGALPAGDDQRLYDFGNFQIASNGIQGASVNLGELWVTYEIALYKPKLVSATGATIPVFQVWSNTGIGTSSTFGSVRTLAAGNTLDVTLSGVTATLPTSVKYGTFFVRYRMSGAPPNAQAYAGTAPAVVSNCTISGTVMNPAVNPATQDGWDMTFTVNVTGPGPAFNIGVAAGSISLAPNITFTIIQVPLGFVPISSW